MGKIMETLHILVLFDSIQGQSLHTQWPNNLFWDKSEKKIKFKDIKPFLEISLCCGDWSCSLFKIEHTVYKSTIWFAVWIFVCF